MKITILFIIFLFPLLAFTAVNDLFLKSLESSRNVEIIKLENQRNLTELDSVKSDLFPDLSLINTNKYGNNSLNTSTGKNEIDSSLGLRLSHSLFQGGAEFSLNDFRKLIPKQAMTLKEESMAQYYGQFSSYYFQVTSLREEKQTIEALVNNLKKRVKLVKSRTKIGRERKADLYALESQLYRLEAELHNSDVQLNSAIVNFSNYSGLPETVKIDDNTDPAMLELTRNVELESRPELQRLKLNVESSVLEAKIEKSSYYPQVDLVSNYYVDKSNSSNNDWDIALTVSLNLFDFGKTSSSVQSKNLTASINRARYDYARFNSNRIWTEYVDNFNTKKTELATFKKALERSRNAYDEQLKDVKRGLITQIEVIRSLDDVISLEKLVIKSALEVKLLYFQAKAFLGKYPKGQVL